MAINVSFNGATIFKPGAYSKVDIDLGGGFPLSPTGLIAIFGEADAGKPGSQEINIANNVFSPDQLPQIREKYKSGPIVDACNFLFAPGVDGAIPSGAQAVYIYKTNASVRAQFSPVAGSGPTYYGTIRSLQYGIGGNQITFKNNLSLEDAATITSSVLTFPLVIASPTNHQLKFSVNGSSEIIVTLTDGSYANVAALIAMLNPLVSANNLIFSAGVAANTVKISMSTVANLHRNGWGRSFQIVDCNSKTDLGLLTHVDFLNVPSIEPMSTITVKNPVLTLEEVSTVGGDIIFTIGRDSSGSCTAASIEIDSSLVTLNQNGSSPANLILDLASYPTIQSLVDYINTLSGWTCNVSSVQMGLQSPSLLDRVTANCFDPSDSGNMAGRIKNDAAQVAEFFSLSSQVELIPYSGTEVKKVGMPDKQGVPNAIYLTGGIKGGSTSADMVSALSKFEKIRVNSVVPLFSRDSSFDVVDQLTDASSSYMIDSIHQAVKTHLSLMSTTKNRSERQGYLSFKGSYTDAKTKAATLAFARAQLSIQDVRQSDSNGNIKWFLPWAGAAMLAGARGGSPIGNPMTFKFFNMSGIRHTGQNMSVSEQDIVTDFDPDLQYDDAIKAGISFWEAPQSGGFRLVVDNTTYGKDANWVYNRANVLYAADVLAYDFRNQLENIYIGLKNTVAASEIKSTCESILNTYLAQGITVSTEDAKSGYKQLVVQINGNTVNISVVVKLVEGIDYVLAAITLQRATATA